MSPAMAAVPRIISETSIVCVWRGCSACVEAPTRTQARRAARAAGWGQWNTGKGEARVENWICPAHAPLREQAIAEHEKRKLTVFDGIKAQKAADDEADLQKREKALRSTFGRFVTYFSSHLTGDQIGAALRLREALLIFETAGYSKMAPDAAGVNAATYGPRSANEAAGDASMYIQSCARKVVAEVQMIHHDAWRILCQTVTYDLTPTGAGEFLNKSRNDRRRREDATAIATDIIDRSTKAILNVRYGSAAKSGHQGY